jgi:hypothetical protein
MTFVLYRITIYSNPQSEFLSYREIPKHEVMCYQ